MATAKKMLSVEETTEALIENISTTQHQHVHRSDRYKEQVDLFSVAGIVHADGALTKLLGHIYGAEVMEIHYSVTFTKGKPVGIKLLNDPPDVDLALKMIKAELSKLHRKAAGAKGGRPDPRNLKGLYLWAGTTGAVGKRNFAEAIKLGIATAGFQATCEKLKISLRRFNLP